MKILILNDIHSGESRESTTHPGTIRQANTEAVAKLMECVDIFNNEKFDLVINMGDVIRDVKDHNKDFALFKNVMQIFARINGEKIFIPGNHELRTLGQADFSTVADPLNINSSPRGYVDIGEYRLYWIDSTLGANDLASVSEETINWLKGVIDPSRQSIIFSHYSIVSLDGLDSFYFDNGYRYMSYTNGSEVADLFKGSKSVVAINAHTHMSTYKILGNVQSVSALAFSENITTPQYPDLNPGIYSLLILEKEKKLFKSYSGGYCFLSFELS